MFSSRLGKALAAEGFILCTAHRSKFFKLRVLPLLSALPSNPVALEARAKRALLLLTGSWTMAFFGSPLPGVRWQNSALHTGLLFLPSFLFECYHAARKPSSESFSKQNHRPILSLRYTRRLAPPLLGKG